MDEYVLKTLKTFTNNFKSRQLEKGKKSERVQKAVMIR